MFKPWKIPVITVPKVQGHLLKPKTTKRNDRDETIETSETTKTTETKRPKQAKRPKRTKINEKVKKYGLYLAPSIDPRV